MHNSKLFRPTSDLPWRTLPLCAGIAVLLVGLFPCGVHAQDTAYPPVDAQIPGPAKASDREAWLKDLRHWREER
ncbi:MAG TPA: hypothetical protein VFU68_01975, partial [Terracidiphilus sp.]|nr:hypothetical protein [Terracidiphilus sp.]